METARRDRRFLSEIEQEAASITLRAGSLLLARIGRDVTVRFKDERQMDPVTDADHEVEALVRSAIHSSFPEHGVLGEEGTEESTSAEYLWVLDPLDGTANFAAGLPFFGVSLALLRNGVPVVGCIFVPYGPSLGSGVLRCSFGNGATFNGEPLVLGNDGFRASAPVALPASYRYAFQLRRDLERQPGELRNLGSICHELAMVVAGGFQYAAFARPRIWDVAAGALLTREAGGMALAWQRRAWRPLDRFVPPPSRPSRPTPSLRDWSLPTLVGSTAVCRQVAPRLRPRQPPPAPVRWALAWRRQLAKALRSAQRWRWSDEGLETANGTPRTQP